MTQHAANLRVLAITRNAGSASFEQRVLAYVDRLAERGIQVRWEVMPRSWFGRGAQRRRAREFDLVWWHRYLLSPLSAWAWRRSARKIVYDFDDAIMYRSRGTGPKPDFLRNFKFTRWVGRCDAALPASEFLAKHARACCANVTTIPMGVDLPAQADRPAGPDGPVELLWLGSRANFRYLAELRPALEDLARRRGGARLRVVGSQPLEVDGLHVDYRPWSPQEQDLALGQCHIGLCPIPDTPWTQGKCPYKVLQYMAHSMAWVGSPVGENLIAAGPAGPEARGLCAAGHPQWVEAMERLIDDADLRRRMGQAGRAYVQARHSRDAIADRLAATFRQIVSG